MAVELFEPRAHHQRIGLAAEVRLRARRHLDGRDKRAAGRRDTVFDGAGNVGICADELRALEDEIRRLRQRIERIRPPLPHDHIVGVHIVHRDARVVERVQKPRLADGKDRAARRLIAQEGRRRKRARIEVLLRHVKPQAFKLLVQFARRIAAVVRQEEVFLVLIVQPLDKLRHPRQHAVAVVDDAVHIADKAFFLVKVDHVVSIHLRSHLLFFSHLLPRVQYSRAPCQVPVRECKIFANSSRFARKKRWLTPSLFDLDILPLPFDANR